VFGTKMRSFIKLPGAGLGAVVAQQFEIGRQILGARLVPIIEPEVDIHSPRKAEAEDQLKAALLEGVNALPSDQAVMVKLTLPDNDNFYRELAGILRRPHQALAQLNRDTVFVGPRHLAATKTTSMRHTESSKISSTWLSSATTGVSKRRPG
jgi:hypothetical protein